MMRNQSEYVRNVLLLSAVVFVGLVLRLEALSARSFWLDEADSWRLMQLPVAEMLARIAQDNHPPLYFLLLKGWSWLFGETELALRGLSVLLGCITILGMYLFGTEATRPSQSRYGDTSRSTSGQSFGLWAAAMVAVSAFQIRWSQEVRMYALGAALASLSSWTLFRVWNVREQSLRYWGQYVLCTVLFAYTHYYALFSIAAQFAFLGGLLIVRSRGSLHGPFADRQFNRVLSAGLLVVLGCLPWGPVFLAQRAQVHEAFWTRPFSAWELPLACYQMFVFPKEPITNAECDRLDPTQCLVTLEVCVGLILLLLYRPTRADWFIFLQAVLPFVLSVAVSILGTQVFYSRYFAFAHLFLLAALARAIDQIQSVKWRRAMGGLALIAGLIGYANYWSELAAIGRPGMRGAMNYVSERSSPGDLIIVNDARLYLPVLYHSPNRANCFLSSHELPIPHFFGASAILSQNLITTEQLQAMPASRIWAVGFERTISSETAPRVAAKWGLAETAVFREMYFGDIVVEMYKTEYE